MVEKQRSAMETVLRETTWMNNSTREAALEKLKAMGLTNVLPEEGFEDETLEKKHKDLVLTEEDYFQNEVNMKRASMKRNLEKLRDLHSSTEFDTMTVNAYYDSVLNRIIFTGAILQPPFFTANFSM
ncbi:endothelin-converting enzyme 1 [Elysia marginata]|uniref:Endothelin-converting enzyme 1 n=1 Tax=Elysia marginata TaxID=1093978 RepID=A0AAV4IPB2_9GAST|nr:endothelin-converting enzyme 1 [Elysia marginata]